uniref:BHLH domain-containing protein n=1 Tax=Arion vulgaris TaxID=1028688 RepID=A0A0B6Y9D3_9EUPU
MDNLTNICEATSQSHDLDNFRPTHRKGKKLLAEKKRRARINNCLMQIRHLVCDGQEEADTDLDKMEKAEI